MTDITSLDLEAALLDQLVAGMAQGKVYCFVAVVGYPKGWKLGVAFANEQGYIATTKDFKTEAEARDYAERMNQHIGRSDDECMRIVISTMGGQRYRWVA